MKTVIFDIDGVLADSSARARRIFAKGGEPDWARSEKNMLLDAFEMGVAPYVTDGLSDGYNLRDSLRDNRYGFCYHFARQMDRDVEVKLSPLIVSMALIDLEIRDLRDSYTVELFKDRVRALSKSHDKGLESEARSRGMVYYKSVWDAYPAVDDDADVGLSVHARLCRRGGWGLSVSARCGELSITVQVGVERLLDQYLLYKELFEAMYSDLDLFEKIVERERRGQ